MLRVEQSPVDISAVAALASSLRGSIATVIEGKTEAIDTALVVLLAGGHLLIEDSPGVGKTKLARSLARVLDCSARRIQFTSDLLPSDITGVSVFRPDTQKFEFRPGGVFANIVIGDEINRATPMAQSALLEAMEEQRVSVDGATYALPSPFLVVATQNPLDMQGTYPLPEAQLDRFMACINMGYPSPESEIAMLDRHVSRDPLTRLTPLCTAADIQAAKQATREVFLHADLKEYLVTILRLTRTDRRLHLGASPRAGLQWARAAQAYAAMRGRNYVIPEDLQALAVPILSHRLIINERYRTGDERRAQATLVEELIHATPTPK